MRKSTSAMKGSLCVAALFCVAPCAYAGDPIEDLVQGVAEVGTFAPAEGVEVSFDSVVSGSHWRDGPNRRVFDSDLGSGDAPQPVGLRGAIDTGALEFSFTPIWWVAAPWTDRAEASASPETPFLTHWELDRWRVDTSVAWRVTTGVELRTQYSYSKDAVTDTDGQHLLDLRLSFSF